MDEEEEVSMTHRAQGAARRVGLEGLVWGGTGLRGGEEGVRRRGERDWEEEGRKLGGGENETGRRGEGDWDAPLRQHVSSWIAAGGGGRG